MLMPARHRFTPSSTALGQHRRTARICAAHRELQNQLRAGQPLHSWSYYKFGVQRLQKHHLQPNLLRRFKRSIENQSKNSARSLRAAALGP
jgi:hypothetical protein